MRAGLGNLGKNLPLYQSPSVPTILKLTMIGTETPVPASS